MLKLDFTGDSCDETKRHGHQMLVTQTNAPSFHGIDASASQLLWSIHDFSLQSEIHKRYWSLHVVTTADKRSAVPSYHEATISIWLFTGITRWLSGPPLQLIGMYMKLAGLQLATPTVCSITLEAYGGSRTQGLAILTRWAAERGGLPTASNILVNTTFVGTHVTRGTAPPGPDLIKPPNMSLRQCAFAWLPSPWYFFPVEMEDRALTFWLERFVFLEDFLWDLADDLLAFELLFLLVLTWWFEEDENFLKVGFISQSE